MARQAVLDQIQKYVHPFRVTKALDLFPAEAQTGFATLQQTTS